MERVGIYKSCTIPALAGHLRLTPASFATSLYGLRRPLQKREKKNYEKLVSESETVLCHNYLHSRKLSGDHNDVLTPVGRG